jgi:uncharacterized membrane protein YfcA
MPETWTPVLIALVGLAVLLYGISKTAMPTLGIVSGPLLAAVLTPTYASGFIVPLLIVGDLFGLALYRQHVQWRLIIRLIPGLLVGFAVVTLAFEFAPPGVLARSIGVLILLSVLIEVYRRRALAVDDLQSVPVLPRAVTAFFGTLAGMTTMAANAGGAAMSLYLVSMRVPMLAFMGTSVWFFFILNLIKVPIVVGLGLLTPDSLLVDLAFLPMLVLGAVLGVAVFKRFDQEAFNRVAIVLSAMAGVWLLVHG